MAKKNLQHLLIALSRFSSLYTKFKKDPDSVMGEAGLSEKEKTLLREGNEAKIRKYLGDEMVALIKLPF